MKFKYSAFTENTPEMREWLESIGYRMVYNHAYGTSILFVNSGLIYETNEGYPSYNLMIKEGHIDCRSNPQLFQAVTAIREDSDYLQWFVADEDAYYHPDYEQTSDMGEQIDIFCGEFLVYSDEKLLYCKHHKATLEELQEHFKI